MIEARPVALARIALTALAVDRSTAAVAAAVAEHTGELRAELVDRLEQAVREELAIIERASTVRELERMDEMHLAGWATTRALRGWLDQPDRPSQPPQLWQGVFDARVHAALWEARTGRFADQWPRVNSWLTGIEYSGASGSTVNGVSA